MLYVLIGIALILPGLIFLTRKRPNAAAVRKLLDELATKNEFTSDTEFISSNRGYMLDKSGERLLYVELDKNRTTQMLIDVAAVTGCEIVRTYKTKSETKSGVAAKYLSKIHLHLLSGDSHPHCKLRFYDEALDNVSDMKMLFQKAWHLKRSILR